jgi:hypothetical protein
MTDHHHDQGPWIHSLHPKDIPSLPVKRHRMYERTLHALLQIPTQSYINDDHGYELQIPASAPTPAPAV